MTKVSETRSALRRIVLTKAAGDYEKMINGMATAQNSPGARIAANDNLRRAGSPQAQRGFTPVKRPGPTQAQQDAWRKAQDADVARIRAALVGKAKAVARPVVNAVRPIVGAVGNIFK